MYNYVYIYIYIYRWIDTHTHIGTYVDISPTRHIMPVQVALQAALDNSTEKMVELSTALTELALPDLPGVFKV